MAGGGFNTLLLRSIEIERLGVRRMAIVQLCCNRPHGGLDFKHRKTLMRLAVHIGDGTTDQTSTVIFQLVAQYGMGLSDGHWPPPGTATCRGDALHRA